MRSRTGSRPTQSEPPGRGSRASSCIRRVLFRCAARASHRATPARRARRRRRDRALSRRRGRSTRTGHGDMVRRREVRQGRAPFRRRPTRSRKNRRSAPSRADDGLGLIAILDHASGHRMLLLASLGRVTVTLPTTTASINPSRNVSSDVTYRGGRTGRATTARGTARRPELFAGFNVEAKRTQDRNVDSTRVVCH